MTGTMAGAAAGTASAITGTMAGFTGTASAITGTMAGFTGAVAPAGCCPGAG
jgi:hypothetical protein